MAGPYDSIYGYGYDTNGLNLGASNPLGAAFQSQVNPASIPAYGATNPVTPTISSITDPWAGMRTQALGRDVNTPGTGAGTPLGFNLGTLNLALQGIGTIGSLWQAFEANKLAKEQFNTSKAFANANLANQIQSYNTALEDRSRSRAFVEGQSPEQAQAYIDKNRLQERQI